jgi:hypothetical protein
LQEDNAEDGRRIAMNAASKALIPALALGAALLLAPPAQAYDGHGHGRHAYRSHGYSYGHARVYSQPRGYYYAAPRRYYAPYPYYAAPYGYAPYPYPAPYPAPYYGYGGYYTPPPVAYRPGVHVGIGLSFGF